MNYHFNFPCAHQFDRPNGVFRQLPEDFRVEEELGFELTGDGEHLWLLVEKTGLNTIDAARILSKVSGIKMQDIAYAGLKDRHAVTQQWFSIQSRMEFPEAAANLEGLKILSQQRNSRKLRRGSHKSNHFIITLKDIEIEADDIARLSDILSRKGVPNYFGLQRFGNSGNNMEKAELLFNDKGGKVPRFQRGIYLSAARSYLFNSVLSSRVSDNGWDKHVDGDVMALSGSSSVFKAQIDDVAIPARIASGDIHPTGPLWGAGTLSSSALVNALENNIAEKYALLSQGLVKAGLKQERRPLRVIPEKFSARPAGKGELVVEFSLPSGTYATSVIREMVVAPGL